MNSQLTSRTGTRRRSLARLSAVLATVLAAVAVWAVARFGLGIDVRQPQGSGPAGQLAAGIVALVSATAALVGWASLALFERFLTYAARWWVTIASLVAMASSVGPLTAPGLPTSSRVVLALLHLVVATVLIPLLYRTSPNRGSR